MDSNIKNFWFNLSIAIFTLYAWVIEAKFFGVHFITNNVKERNQLFEKLITISGQGPIDINSLEINETYSLCTDGKVKLKPLFS